MLLQASRLTKSGRNIYNLNPPPLVEERGNRLTPNPFLKERGIKIIRNEKTFI
jgi:hypothetical protein